MARKLCHWYHLSGLEIVIFGRKYFWYYAFDSFQPTVQSCPCLRLQFLVCSHTARVSLCFLKYSIGSQGDLLFCRSKNTNFLSPPPRWLLGFAVKCRSVYQSLWYSEEESPESLKTCFPECYFSSYGTIGTMAPEQTVIRFDPWNFQHGNINRTFNPFVPACLYESEANLTKLNFWGNYEIVEGRLSFKKIGKKWEKFP